ncbi:MAG: DnaA/Hda family protein [Sedimentitalea sp.]
MAHQLSFDLPAKEVLGRDDFFVSPANAMAVAMIEATPNWPNQKLVLSGPPGSGKTHLVHVWASLQNAQIVSARDLNFTTVPDLAKAPVAVEDVGDIANNDVGQTALFHLFNLSGANGQPMLMTGRGAPHHWHLSLPDLQSRLSAACHVALEAPDDALLSAVLAKLFADRQITPKANVIPYLSAHMDRSFQAAAAIVDRLDQVSLDEARTVSRALAVRLLGTAPTKP